jgi:Lrp/AsnC family leucine-responsive transcriptional regulator
VADIKLDEKDFAILDALRKDARQTIAELSNMLGIPRATVHERIVGLRKSGVIQRFTIAQDYKKTGLPTLSFVFAEYDRGAKADQHQVSQAIAKIPGVLGVYIVSGEWDILIKIRGKSIEDMGMIIIDRIRNTPGVLKTYSMTCYEVAKDEV